MSAIRSALEEWTGESLEQVSVDQLGDDLVEIETVSGLLEAERLRRLHAFEARAGHHRFDQPSTTAFLKAECGMASGRAHRLVTRSRTLRAAESTFDAWRAGRLSTDQAAVFLDQAAALPERFAQDESDLVEIVEDLGVSDTRRALGYWRQSVDGPGTIRTETEQQELRGISASRSLDGMVRVDGWMTPTAGQALLTALTALLPPPIPGDNRTPRQRRHDALEDLARHYLDGNTTPVVGGEKPHLNILCDLPALQGLAGGLHQTETGQLLTINQLRTITCDCSVSRIVIGPDSEIIDVGHRTRVIPTATRRAVITRDRHCTWKSCDRPARWCDIHHIIHWASGGQTKPDNLTLLCRYHHTLTHHHQDPNRGPPPPTRTRRSDSLTLTACEPR